jgi:tRNA(fMet)-specific endonuclease VapC
MDTNHVAAWEVQNQSLIGKMNSLPPNTLIYTSAITLGEISAGHEMTGGDALRHHRVRQFLNLYIIPTSLPISHYTESYYGEIIGRIWKRTPPAKGSISTDAHLVNLGVNINDVWIVASALEHGLTLLTADKMACIRTIFTASEVTWDNWL